jgi:hypothetical protein
VGALGLQGIDPEGDQPLHGVQIGVGGAPAGAKREVAGVIGEGQLVGENKLTGDPLPALLSDRAGEWRRQGR